MSEKILQPISLASGRAVAIHGNDIDTDRIIPARYMKVVTFDGLEKFAFRDERFDPQGKPKPHPFNDEARQGASIMVVNANFGCGSSREHAPQSLVRWGIRGIVGEGFAEIFFGNCVTLGVPCVVLPHERIVELQKLVDADPSLIIEIDVDKREVRAGAFRADCTIPDGPRSQFLAGTWDALAVLLEAGDEIEATARRLPYISGF